MQYYQLLSAKISLDFIKQSSLDDCEVLIILKETILMMYSMLEFEFEKQLFENLDHTKKEEFFSTMEILNGKSLVDIFIGSDDVLHNQFQKPLEKIQECDCQLISKFLEGDERRLKMF